MKKFLAAVAPFALFIVICLRMWSVWNRGNRDEPPQPQFPGVDNKLPVDVLVKQLGDRNVEVRERAAQRLAQRSYQETLPAEVLQPLLEAAHDPHGNVRHAAGVALGAMGPNVVPTLFQALIDEERSMQVQEAVWLLGGVEAGLTAPAVHRALRRENEEFAITLGGALSRHTALATQFAEKLNSEQPATIRLAAMFALSKAAAERPDILAKLTSAFDDDSVMIRSLSVLILSRAGSKAVPVLIDSLDKESTPNRRLHAAQTLAEIGRKDLSMFETRVAAVPTSPKVVHDMREKLRQERVAIRQPAVPALRATLQDKNPATRMFAATALADFPDERTVVIETLRDLVNRPAQRQQAEALLKRLEAETPPMKFSEEASRKAAETPRESKNK